MITMLKRHEIQVLRGAGHKLKQIAKKVGVSERSVRRIAKESPVVTVSHGEARAARRVGRPSTVEAFRKSVEEILSKDPGAPTVGQAALDLRFAPELCSAAPRAPEGRGRKPRRLGGIVVLQSPPFPRPRGSRALASRVARGEIQDAALPSDGCHPR